MSVCTVQFRGESIGVQTSMKVILPDQGDGPFPVLYLLHGYSDDCSIWHRRTRLEVYVAGLPLIVVMPDGYVSFYANSKQFGAYEDHIMRDVVGYIDRFFPAIASREGRAIAGLSMGGFGAMMLGLKHRKRFAAAVSHSGLFRLGRTNRVKGKGPEALATTLRKREYNCHSLATEARRARIRPAIRFDCGTEDFLLDDNRKFRAHLRRIDLPHEYEEHPGGHTWDYWDLHIRETLDFVMRHLKTV